MTRLLLDRHAGQVVAVLLVGATIGLLKLLPRGLADSTVADLPKAATQNNG